MNRAFGVQEGDRVRLISMDDVSYTNLTLPTI